MDDMPLRDWLKGRRESNGFHLELMALQYDLEGALEAGQSGLAWWARNGILVTSSQLFLHEAGVKIPASRDRAESIISTIDAMTRINPELGNQIWDLLLQTEPGGSEIEEEVCRTFAFIENNLKLSSALSRQGSVLQWAESTRVLRSVAEKLNMAQTNDWYLSSSTALQGDWYKDILAVLEGEKSDRR